MTTTVANKPPGVLAREALAHIEAHPEEWDQTTYRACFAMHVARQAGAVPTRRGSDVVIVPGSHTETEHVRRYAVEQLELTEPWIALFCTQNTLEDLRRLVDEYWPEGS